ncbi:hypothetical protein Nepgr_011659 [Nepenthes gracilis]|uniref:RNA polymerase sigma-70 domain-containing protein n=1 Tax=Nepenthes gracilis TaxID=150966 RepID=A0AAD3SER3_NEPGR|nr:hypothetical protein Nepgr_011659 [Nepenthes gracilis]
MMEAAMNFLSPSPPFPLRTHLRNYLPPLPPLSSFSSVYFLHEQASTAVSSMPTTSACTQFPTSVLLQEQRDDYRFSLNIVKGDRPFQSIWELKQMVARAPVCEDNIDSSDQFPRTFKQQQLHLPRLSCLLPSLPDQENTSLIMWSVTADTEKHMDLGPCEAISLAKEALAACKEAASLAESAELLGSDSDESSSLRTNPCPMFPVTSFVEEKTVRSTRHLERRTKKRKFAKPKETHESSRSAKVDTRRKLSEDFDLKDPLRFFLWGPETTQLLTVEEECELISKIQDLNKLEAVKRRLQSQFDREPTLIEWADAAGLSCKALQLQLHSGNNSREKLIYANFRMVVHIAKQYQGRGLGLQDLLQEGSVGLMKSVEKFKTQAGCRFPSYAYWWIRQAVRKAIFQHSRTIRLPENVYSLLSKVMEAKKSYIQEGHQHPTKEQLALRVGITVEKLQNLHFLTRIPLSLQQHVWMDQETTLQEVIPDTGIERPDVSVAKQLMRRHIRSLLISLTPKERKIIKLRYGVGSGKQNSLSEIGAVFGLSKERVRQLENRALNKLKQSVSRQGLKAYADLLA